MTAISAICCCLTTVATFPTWRRSRAHFITFDTYLRWELPPAARDLVLQHCLHDNGKKMQLYIVVVMPDHVHMIFMPLETEKHETFSFEEIVGAIKSTSAHSVNPALNRSGTVWILVPTSTAEAAVPQVFRRCGHAHVAPVMSEMGDVTTVVV
jgi:hypothetical protein